MFLGISIRKELMGKIDSLIPVWSSWVLVILGLILITLLMVIFSLATYLIIFQKKGFPKTERFAKVLFIIFIIDALVATLFFFFVILFKIFGFFAGIIVLIAGISSLTAFFYAFNKIATEEPFEWKKFGIWALIAATSFFILSLLTGHHLA